MNTTLSEAGTSVASGIDVSVVIPVYKGVAWISDCLESLSRQTLDPARYELILVFNGPDDGALELARETATANKDLQLRLMRSPIASAPHARNLGTSAARGRYLTWVDCDDWVSPEYLELLLLSARPGKVPLAQIVNVSDDLSHDADNLINKSILEQQSHIVSPADFHRGLSFMTCKLIPTWMAKAVPFDEGLRSGEDVALFARMYSMFPFQFNLVPAFAGAKYFRLLRDSSVSRPAANYDFMVTQRLDVISSLNDSLKTSRPEAVGLIKGFINSQASFVKRYLLSHPEEMRAVADDLAVRVFGYFPWTALFQDVSTLVIAYNFLPYSDTGAMVTGKRLRAMAVPVDVVSHSMENVRQKDDSHRAIAQPYVQFLSTVEGPAIFAGYAGISDFCQRGMLFIESWIQRGRNYKTVYSRAMWPASHFLAALFKVRHPSVKWIAEFSDPIQLDNNGVFRDAPLECDAVADEILAAVCEEDRAVLMANLNVYFWTEYLAYALADEVVLTNENQRQVMSGYADQRGVTAIARKSAILPQPTLPSCFYDVNSSRLKLDRSVVNIGYFGEFYSTRGLEEVLEAMLGVDEETRSRVCLHVFTSNPQAAQTRLQEGFQDLSDHIRVNESLGYFEFLNTLKQFDCLIVNDAVTVGCHEVNPYLPSKLSDYRGSETPVWAIVEPGSVLSLGNHDFVSVVADVAGAKRVISALVGSTKQDHELSVRRGTY